MKLNFQIKNCFKNCLNYFNAEYFATDIYLKTKQQIFISIKNKIKGTPSGENVRLFARL